MRHLSIAITIALFVSFVAPTTNRVVAAGEQAQTGQSSGGGTGGGQDFTSTIVQKFETAAKQWEEPFKKIALRVFFILAAIALVVKFAPIVLSGGSRDFGDFSRELVMFILTASVLFWMVNNGPELFRDLVNFFTESANQINNQGFSANDILPAAINLGQRTLKAIGDGTTRSINAIKNSWSAKGLSGEAFSQTFVMLGLWFNTFIIGLACLVITIIAVIIAGIISIKYAVVLTASYIVAYAGVIILGFSGWGFTRDVIVSYFKTAAGFGIQLMCFTLLMQLGQTFIIDMGNSLNTDNTVLLINDFVVFLTCMIMWYILIDKVPPMVAGILGAPSLQMSSTGSMAMAAGGMALAGAAMPLAAAKGAAAASKAADAAAHASGSKGGASMSQKITAGLKGAAGAMAQGMGAAVKTAAQGGSFGSVMRSASDGANSYSANVNNQMKEAQQEQKQAQRDETQAQIAQNLGTLTAALNPSPAAADDGGSGNGGSGDGGSGNGGSGDGGSGNGGSGNGGSGNGNKGLDGRLTGQQPGGNDSNITADATRGQAPANGGNAAPQTDPAAAPRPGRPKNAAAQPPKPTGNAPKNSGNAQKPATSQAAKNTVYDPHKPIPPIDS